MTHKEFFEIAKEQPWKTIECETGKECWCRIITTDPPIDDHFVASWGSISKDTAEYIVQLHNQRLNKEEFKEYILNNEIITLDDFNNDDIVDHLESEHYYVFEYESEIENYVETDLDYQIFANRDDIFEYAKMNDDNYQQFDSIGKDIVGMIRFKDAIKLIDDLAKKNGWEWIYEKLTSC